jgi:hypothetical protein
MKIARFLSWPVRTGLLLAGLVLPAACGGGGATSTTTGSTTSTTTPSSNDCVNTVNTPVKTATPISQLPYAKRAAALAAALGKPQRLLVGLGSVDLTSVQAQSLRPDIYDTYLNEVGPTSWPNWNSPSGQYVQIWAKNADCLGAIPMYTLYQMATRGDGNLTVLQDYVFMQGYWANVSLLFNQLKTYGKPALVNFEPDFWGYAQRISRDPTRQFAQVTLVNPDCTDLGDDVAGLTGCLIRMARKYAPNAYIGFPPAQFGDVGTAELDYFKAIGADKADFLVMQTLDRDIGCIEAAYTASNANCLRNRNTTYLNPWDESNATTPNFAQHLASAKNYSTTLGLPLIWWQTPLGVASNTPGGSFNAFRDNRVRYFLTHPAELVAAGGLGVVFSPGHTSQTNINTDGGQFRTYSGTYFAKPAALP